MQADSQPHLDPPGPGAGVHRPLDLKRGLQRGGGAYEHRKEIVAAGGHHATTRGPHRGAHQAANIGEQGSVLIAEAPEQLG